MRTIRSLCAAAGLVSMGCTAAETPPMPNASSDACDRYHVHMAECDVSEALVAAWDSVGGGRRKVSCTVKVQLDPRGRVVGRELSECAEPALMDRAMRLASPIRIHPNTACVREAVTRIPFALGGDGVSAISRH